MESSAYDSICPENAYLQIMTLTRQKSIPLKTSRARLMHIYSSVQYSTNSRSHAPVFSLPMSKRLMMVAGAQVLHFHHLTLFQPNIHIDSTLWDSWEKLKPSGSLTSIYFHQNSQGVYNAQICLTIELGSLYFNCIQASITHTNDSQGLQMPSFTIKQGCDASCSCRVFPI